MESGENVFGKTLPWLQIFICLILIALLIFLIFRLVQAAKFRKQNGKGPYNGGGRYGGGYESNGYGNYHNTGNYGSGW